MAIIDFTTASSNLDKIRDESAQHLAELNRILAQLTALETRLAEMPGKYQGFGTDLNETAAANPSDEEWQQAKRLRVKFGGDFTSLKNRVSAIIAAIQGL